MQLSDIPRKLSVVWASMAGNAYVRQVPTAASSQPGVASYAVGFPPETFVPVAGGGVPPAGADMNGALFDVTGWARWLQVGGAIPFDPTYAQSTGGYPRNARIASSTVPGLTWVSLIDNNTGNPDANPANWIIEGYRGLVGDLSNGSVQFGPMTANFGNVVQTGTSGRMPVTFATPFKQILFFGASNDTGASNPSAWAGVGQPSLNGMTVGQSVSAGSGGRGLPAPAGTAAWWWAIGLA